MLIDVHAHIFPEIRGLVAGGATRGLGYGRAAISNKEIQMMPPLNERTEFTHEMLIANMDWAGVDKAILLQGTFYGDWNQYILEAIKRYPERLSAAAYFDPWSLNNRRLFENIVSENSFRAIKLEMSELTGFCGIYPETRLDTPELAWLWNELERRRLILVIDLGSVGSRSYQTDAVRTIAEEYPNLRIVIAHLAQPNPKVEQDPVLWRMWEKQIDLGKLPNIWFDTASLPAYVSNEGYPYPTAARYLRMAIDKVGPHKIMWGSDIPGLLVHLNYLQLVKLAELHTQFLPSYDKDLILSKNAKEVYNLL